MTAHHCRNFCIVAIFDEGDDARYKRIVATCVECEAKTVFHHCFPIAMGESTVDYEGKFLVLPSFFEVDHQPREDLLTVSKFKSAVEMTRFSVDAPVAEALCKWAHASAQV